MKFQKKICIILALSVSLYYLQVYLEECKYKITKMEISRFINAELHSEPEPESETELMAKVKSGSDSE